MAGSKNIMLGTAGHVDHGKTALVKLLTGCDTDTLAEEKARGLTLDLGFAPCRLPDNRVIGVVDVPGHVDFIRHMVAGAHGIDIVILVVAADDGIMPQTREHLDILTLMGVRRGLVALTKIDLVEPSRRDEVLSSLRTFLTGTFLESAQICPLSNVTGEGFDAFYDALAAEIDACDSRPCTGLFRTWIADAFTIKGFGTVVTGIPSSGNVKPGDQLFLVPENIKGRVRRLEVYGQDASEGRAGECVAMNVPEFEHTTLKRGMVVTCSDALLPVLMAEAEFKLLPNVTGELRDNTEVHLHIGTASVMAKLAFLETDRMVGGQSQMIQLRISEPLGLLPGDRFVVRASLPGSEQGRLTTIGGGRVLGNSNVKLRRRRPWTISNLRMRAAVIDQPRHWIEQLLRESDRPLTFSEWARLSFRSGTEMLPDLHALIATGRAVQNSNGQFVHIDSVEALADLVISAVRMLHTTNPKRLGFHPREIGEALDTVLESPGAQDKQAQNQGNAAASPGHSAFLAARLAEDKDVLSMAIEIVTREGELERRGDLVAISGWRVSVSSQEELAVQQVESLLRGARFSPPSKPEMAKALGLPQNVVDSAIKLLIEQGKAVQPDKELVFHSDAIAAAQAVVLQLFAHAPSFTTMQFRDALGVSRKYAVPLLDYMDSQRLTVRTGNVRTPGALARQRLG